MGARDPAIRSARARRESSMHSRLPERRDALFMEVQGFRTERVQGEKSSKCHLKWRLGKSLRKLGFIHADQFLKGKRFVATANRKTKDSPKVVAVALVMKTDDESS